MSGACRTLAGNKRFDENIDLNIRSVSLSKSNRRLLYRFWWTFQSYICRNFSKPDPQTKSLCWESLYFKQLYLIFFDYIFAGNEQNINDYVEKNNIWELFISQTSTWFSISSSIRGLRPRRAPRRARQRRRGEAQRRGGAPMRAEWSFICFWYYATNWLKLKNNLP